MKVKRYGLLSSSDRKTPLPNTANPTSLWPICDRIPFGPLLQLGRQLFRRLAATVRRSGCFIPSPIPHKSQAGMLVRRDQWNQETESTLRFIQCWELWPTAFVMKPEMCPTTSSSSASQIFISSIALGQRFRKMHISDVKAAITNIICAYKSSCVLFGFISFVSSIEISKKIEPSEAPTPLACVWCAYPSQ